MFGLLVAMAVLMIYQLPAHWEVMCFYSDRLEQVEQGLAGLDAEMAERLQHVAKAKERCLMTHGNYAQGIGKIGEQVDEKRRQELIAEAPRWQALADKAQALIDKYTPRER